MTPLFDHFGARATLPGGSQAYYRLAKLEEDGIASLGRLPFSIKVLLEALLRTCDGFEVNPEDVVNLANWQGKAEARFDLPFKPARVVLQDFTGVPTVVDLAALRSAMARLGGDPERINPLVPVDLVIDHSVQVDMFGNDMALFYNAEREFERNRERYEFLKWGQEAFQNFKVVPPATGIVHQVNLEYLAKVVMTGREGEQVVAFPDTLVGTDSHTTMINGLGVVGWGVGGIEAEAVMLGQPLFMLSPEVVGFKLTGRLPEGGTATDLVLVVTEILRQHGVVGKFVEYFGPGLSTMSLPDRATIANMSPEYGATIGYFPVDQETLNYMRRTGRPDDLIELVERYTKAQGLFRSDESADPEFSEIIELDLGSVQPSLAGPKRPQDRILMSNMKAAFSQALQAPLEMRGFGLGKEEVGRRVSVSENGHRSEIGHGSVVIAAITSCTNTSNPSVMLAAGLLARKAVERGVQVKPYVKTSMAPGSKVVSSYMDAAGLTAYLEKLGFHVVGYGCTTCIGNSGPLPEAIEEAVEAGNLVVVSVLSGNRNFEGRIHPQVKASYLASPPLVIAYALAGRADIDLTKEALGADKAGRPVYLRDLWPTSQEIERVVAASLTPDMFHQQYSNVYTGNETWNNIPSRGSELYDWDPTSTYIQKPPFFADMGAEVAPISEIANARVLVMVGDSVTTDHISPAGAISSKSPAGQYLLDHDVGLLEFNSYGSRRGNDQVMTRGTFANVRLRNQMAPGTEGGWTTFLPSGEVMSIFDASVLYRADAIPLVVLAGKEYGTGSSRDWAAKGPQLLGVKLVIAESYERIHRSNLVGMGILPLQFRAGESPAALGLDGTEFYSTVGLDDGLQPNQVITVQATKPGRTAVSFQATCRIDTPVEVEYYRDGGILHSVLRRFIREELAEQAEQRASAQP
ncbi:MAG: aconitate hydratase AcnA [Candidatus Promineifilaceae bacterium]